jgi:ABC-type multidrug transport system fused ATPase/permease subunit
MTSPLLGVHRLLGAAERRRALVLVGLMVVGMALETLCTALVAPAIALMMRQNQAADYPLMQQLLAALGNPTQVELVVAVMLGLVVIFFTKNVFLAYLAWRQTRFAYGVQAQLAHRLFAIYLRQPYTFHLQRNSAQLIRNVTGEVSLFTQTIISGLNVGTELLVLFGISCLLLIVEPLGTLIAVSVLGGSAWIFHQATRTRLADWGTARQKHDGLRMQHLQQGLGGAKDVKLLGREEDFIDQFRVHNAQSARVGQYQAALQMLPRLWLEMLAVLGLATLVVTMLLQGRDMSVIFPTLGLFAAAAFRLLPSVNRVLAAVQILRYTLPVVDTLQRELRLQTVEAPGGHPRVREKIAEFQDEIRLCDVTFTYPAAETTAIRGVSIRIAKGDSVGLIGTSGSGKSTLVDLILGLLAPSTGRIEVDGRDIQDDLRAWQDQIGYVPQTIYLTDDTLRRNVAFGLPDADIDDAAVRRALRAAQLVEFAAALPKGLDTAVGERGVRLSGGQRQRIGIARALYHDPPVLVLDEATSALDTDTEREVMYAVTALHGAKTVLIVAHRLSTVGGCDRLYRLENGRIVEETGPSAAVHTPKAAGAADRVRR